MSLGVGSRFSVVVPTRNRPRQLGACLDALARLDYEAGNFEVVVVDDGSGCAIADVVAQHRGSLVPRLLRQHHQGPAAARNAGVAVARGDWLAFTDDDCEPAPDWLTALATHLARDPSCLVGGRTVNGLAANPFARTSQLIVDMVLEHYNPDPAQARFFPSNNMATSRSAFTEVGGFRADFRTSEDRDICDRFRLAGRHLRFAPEAVVAHAHDMDLVAFVRQHVSYGRGAWRFLRAHRQRTGGTTLEGSFYARLCRELPGRLRREPRPVQTAALLALWQVANAGGFVLEAARQLLDGERPRPPA
jgi:glycosyltransferase involved in cell wall biosynthesis